MKNNVAPMDLLVESIVDELHPYKNGLSRADVLADIRRDIDKFYQLALSDTKRYSRRALKEQREHARKFNKALDNVEKLMASAPGELAQFLRRDLFSKELRKMRNMCGFAVDLYGFHPNEDILARECVCFAYATMCRLSKARISSSSPKSKFRVIAGLFYQVVSGREADLERACDRHNREMKAVLRARATGTDPAQ